MGLTLLASAASGQQHQGRQNHSQELRHPTAHHRFDDAERWSREFDNPERDAWQKPQEVIGLMEIEPGMTVADIGAGTGYFLGHLSAAVGSDGVALGLDIEPVMVRFMEERADREGWSNVESRVIAPDGPGLPAGSIDRVLIVNTWHHIADRERYSPKLLESLTASGRVLVVDFTLESTHGPPVSQRLSPEAVEKELRAGGFETQVLEETLPEQYIVAGWRPR